MENSLDNVLALGEASFIWGIDDSSLRHAISRGKFKSDEIRKSGSTWLILKQAMVRVYGELKKNSAIYTIGYEGKAIETFVEVLRENNIHMIFDVREIPLSRKKGFSKNTLQDILSKNDIGYQHFKELGSPKTIREQLYENKDYKKFFDSFRAYLEKQPETMDIIKTAIKDNSDKNFCLMCFEKNPNECHRSIIAEQIISSKSKAKKIGLINL